MRCKQFDKTTIVETLFQAWSTDYPGWTRMDKGDFFCDDHICWYSYYPTEWERNGFKKLWTYLQKEALLRTSKRKLWKYVI